MPPICEYVAWAINVSISTFSCIKLYNACQVGYKAT